MKTLRVFFAAALMFVTGVAGAGWGIPPNEPHYGYGPHAGPFTLTGATAVELDPADATQNEVMQPEDTNCNGQCGGQCGEGEQHQYGLQQ